MHLSVCKCYLYKKFQVFLKHTINLSNSSEPIRYDYGKVNLIYIFKYKVMVYIIGNYLFTFFNITIKEFEFSKLKKKIIKCIIVSTRDAGMDILEVFLRLK